ncbi:hypothetical protein BDV30DRAFT_237188 [Aspergillus minisclerotigenes]|uniref:Uncharacterized protein n=1 Tax=Aspergillus minisclerotigenes TaxID=656917 RepID=A0A5N6JAQ9_9EURO|nr:hypothetical protein BDV30DRAFT_237188 [Aspergillus minisclerotigenes]
MPNSEKYASLMSEPRKASLHDQKKRTASQISQLSQSSAASSSISDFLEQKLKAPSSQGELLKFRYNWSLEVFNRPTWAIDQDFEDDASHEQKLREGEPDDDFFERAYVEHTDGENSGGIIGAKEILKRDQSKFRKAVLYWYET